MMFAFSHPAMTLSLIVIDGASELNPLLRSTAEAWKAAALANPIAFYRTIIPWNYSSTYIGKNWRSLAEREATIARLPRAYFEDFVALCDAFLTVDLTPHLHRISCPTLVLVGEKDILKPVAFARIIAEGVPGARLKVLPSAGHAAVIEQPESLLACIEEFLHGL
jgi:3-oxoadipate enol-lactonase